MSFHFQSKLGLLSVGLFLLTYLWQVDIAHCEESSYESDRGYREPAVMGPAIIDEAAPLAIEDEQESQLESQAFDSISVDSMNHEAAYR